MHGLGLKNAEINHENKQKYLNAVFPSEDFGIAFRMLKFYLRYYEKEKHV